MIDAWSARTAIARALGDFSWRHYLATLRASAAIPIQRVGSALYLLLPATLAASFFGLHVAGWFVLADRTVRAVNGLSIVFFADRSQGTFAACCMLVEAALMIWLAVAVLRRKSADAAPVVRTHTG